MLSTIMSSNEWQFLQYLVPLCVIFVFVCICRLVLHSDFDIDSPLLPSLLLCYCLSLPMRSTGTKKQPARCDVDNTGHQKEKPPAVLEPAKKKPVKEKRKRKKSAEKDNKDISLMESKVQCRQAADRRSVIYDVLPLCLELRNKFKLKDEELYFKFNKFTLTQEELIKKGFPLENPEKPGSIIVSSCKKVKNEDPTSKICSRCFEKFHIINDEYEANTPCFYHPVRCHKQLGLYSCCQSSYGSTGCKKSQYHVHYELDLENLEFKKIDGKRLARKDQSFKVYALDCEMVFTTIGMEVAKVGLVDVEGKTVYQSYVVPDHPVLDFNTEFSGITQNHLMNVQITLSDVQSVLLRILNKDTILVGHALQNDLRVLRLVHEKVVDTQVVFHEGTHLRKLKTLSQEYLKKTIQDTKEGHDSIEDARACMELMLWKISTDFEYDPESKVLEVNNSDLQNGPEKRVLAVNNKPDNVVYNPSKHKLQDLLDHIDWLAEFIMKNCSMLEHEWNYARLEAETTCMLDHQGQVRNPDMLIEYIMYMENLQDHIDRVNKVVCQKFGEWEWWRTERQIKCLFEECDIKNPKVMKYYIEKMKYYARIPMIPSDPFSVTHIGLILNNR